ncbi:hypothetical protein AX16_010704 [Volvariella volvacea WC 439]|nr:hypothetical protein AX16_010704 [Volvariella volvacea WC 439]
MSLYNYVDAPDANLVCCICRNPFLEPTTIRSCNHTFCRDCILQSLEHSKHCPVDRSPITEGDLVLADPIIRSLVDELVVECVHSAAGCDHTCQRQHLATHLSDSCPYSYVSCPENECDGRFLRKEAGRHKHRSENCSVEQCRSQLQDQKLETHQSEGQSLAAFTCTHCLPEFSSAELAEHSCPAEQVSCPHANSGCPYKGSRDSLDGEHLPSCPYEALKGFFAINNSRISHLAEENLRLRSRVQGLEGTVKTMRAELAAARSALGPWYRTPTTASQLLYASAVGTTQVPSNLAAASDPSANLSTDVYSEIASYFPEGITSDLYQSVHRPPANLNPLHEHIGTTSRLGSHTTNPPQSIHGSSTTQTMIAPLNLSTTLEGTLAGLRQSVVTLSATVDSLGRRNEIALSNEVLRLNEEMMSLRANIHGLRMQVRTCDYDGQKRAGYRTYGLI